MGLCLLWLISIQLTLDNGSTQQTLRLHRQPLHRLKKHKGHVAATSERDRIPEGASIESPLNQNQERKKDPRDTLTSFSVATFIT